MEHITIAVESYVGVTIKNTLLTQGSERLLVLLPGVGYLVSHTHLHLTGLLGLQLGYDVLSVPYGFQVTQAEFDLAQAANIQAESAQAVQKALQRGYTSAVIVGKSFGTPIAALLANQLEQVQSTILLTPIQDSHKLIERATTLAIIGTADRHYHDELAQDTDIVTWRVYADLDHGLMRVNDVQGSIAVLPDIMREIENFLTL